VPRLTAHHLLAFAVVILCGGRAAAGQLNVASEINRHASGSFVFTDSGSHHAITVWFCRPPVLGTDTRIAFIMHGSDSQTARQACDIAAPEVQALNAIVLAPQFSGALPAGRVHVR
jgi:hypothetical protein